MSAVEAPRVATRRQSRSPGPAGNGIRNASSSPANTRQETDAKHPKKRLPAAGVPSLLLRRQEQLLRRGGAGRTAAHRPPPPSSLTASFASEASTDSFCSRASTGRIGRPAAAAAARRRAAGSAGPPAARPTTTTPTTRKAASLVGGLPGAGGVAAASVNAAAVAVAGSVNGDPSAPARCPWVTPNTDPCYAAFHDQEWGVPVHEDKRLFEMLVLSGALAEMAWPVILSKRETFREVFLNFDPVLVAKLSEKKFLGPSSPASSLLSEHRVRIIIENARELLKVIDEFGSFDSYCWSFVSNKPLIGRFRHMREVPLRTAKADAVSQDLMRRGFRGVGPTVVYAFMQAVGMANDHLVTCYRFEECCATATAMCDGHGDKPAVAAPSNQEVSMVCGLVQCVGLEHPRAATVISIS